MTTVDRYTRVFTRLSTRGEGAFVPFLMLGDPSPEETLEIIRTVIAAGADALELGVPFSDPVADGPTIQRSHLRARANNATVDQAFCLIRRVRDEYPEIPIGLLIYGNVPFSRGLTRFYDDCSRAGADSVLIPDVPVREAAPFITAAHHAGIAPIFIAPAQAAAATVTGVARYSEGYIYAVSRDGVTGTEREATATGLAEVIATIQKHGGAPVLVGFGISTPAHVAAAMAAGARGAITGSAITSIIEKHCVGEYPQPSRIADMPALTDELTRFVADMKHATIQ